MSAINSVQHTILTCTLGTPENDLAIMRGACKELLLVRMPSDNSNLVFVTLKTIELTVHFTDVIELNFLVATPR